MSRIRVCLKLIGQLLTLTVVVERDCPSLYNFIILMMKGLFFVMWNLSGDLLQCFTFLASDSWWTFFYRSVFCFRKYSHANSPVALRFTPVLHVARYSCCLLQLGAPNRRLVVVGLLTEPFPHPSAFVFYFWIPWLNHCLFPFSYFSICCLRLFFHGNHGKEFWYLHLCSGSVLELACFLKLGGMLPYHCWFPDFVFYAKEITGCDVDSVRE